MSDATPKRPEHQKPRGHALLWLMLFLIATSALYAGRFFYLNQQQLAVHLQAIDQQQQSAQAEASQKIEDLKRELAKKETLDPMNSDQQWALYKAQYAIQLAQLNAKWSDDTATTLALLQQADGFLSSQNNAQLFPVRQALAREISEAKAITVLDVPGLLSQLDALQDTVTTYTFTKPIEPQSTPSPTATAPAQHTWREHAKATLLAFKQFFVIRYHDNPLEPLMSPAFQTVQKEIIRLNLQEAEWAILERNNTIFQIALKKAHENMARAFGTDNDKVVSMLKQLDELQTLTLENTPFIPSDSLPLLEAIIKDQSSVQPGATS